MFGQIWAAAALGLCCAKQGTPHWALPVSSFVERTVKHIWGLPISGVAEADAVEGVKVYHAGTKQNESSLVTSGGWAHRLCGELVIHGSVKEKVEQMWHACVVRTWRFQRFQRFQHQIHKWKQTTVARWACHALDINLWVIFPFRETNQQFCKYSRSVGTTQTLLLSAFDTFSRNNSNSTLKNVRYVRVMRCHSFAIFIVTPPDFACSPGRVLAVTGQANDFKDALRRAYEAVSKISFDPPGSSCWLAAEALLSPLSLLFGGSHLCIFQSVLRQSILFHPVFLSRGFIKVLHVHFKMPWKFRSSPPAFEVPTCISVGILATRSTGRVKL